jgi:hypothetical protein
MLTNEQTHKILTEVFFQRDKGRESEFEAPGGQPGPKLVHYTSAQAAFSILSGNDEETRCLWLRNATEMNDFSEVAFGQQMLINALNDTQLQNSFLTACREVNPEIGSVFSLMGQEFETIRLNTYLLSLSRHTGLELEIGLLSMWRAYGGSANVCLVFNTEAFANEQHAYSVAIAPVDYTGVVGVRRELERIRDAMIAHKDVLRQIEPMLVTFNLKYALDIMLLSTKHPGFKEEEEWRLIYRPPDPPPEESDVPSKVVCLNGIVQTVYYLPMKDIPEKGLKNANLNELLHKVIVGPTPNPFVVRNAFIRLLAQAGIEDAEHRVSASGIPLRR